MAKKTAVQDAPADEPKAAAPAEVPAGTVSVVAPEGVTAVSGGVCIDGRWYVAPAIAEALVRMHGFTR